MKAIAKDAKPGDDEQVCQLLEHIHNILFCIAQQRLIIFTIILSSSSECDFERIGTFTGVSGQCLNHQGCTEVYGGKTRLETYNYHWTNFPCSIEVKVITNGMVAFIHNPTHKFPLFGTTEYVDTQVHVNASETVSYAFVPWGTNNVEVGKVRSAWPLFIFFDIFHH